MPARAFVMRVVRRAVFALGNLARAAKVAYLRSAGVTIGTNTMISMGAKIDSQWGKVIIGNNCHVTHGCVILAHDGTSFQLPGNKENVGRVTIGDGVFLGVNSVVLPNVTIGDNAVIGAGSVVTQAIPANCVAAGNPARVIRRFEPPTPPMPGQ